MSSIVKYGMVRLCATAHLLHSSIQFLDGYILANVSTNGKFRLHWNNVIIIKVALWNYYWHISKIDMEKKSYIVVILYIIAPGALFFFVCTFCIFIHVITGYAVGLDCLVVLIVFKTRNHLFLELSIFSSVRSCSWSLSLCTFACVMLRACYVRYLRC